MSSEVVGRVASEVKSNQLGRLESIDKRDNSGLLAENISSLEQA